MTDLRVRGLRDRHSTPSDGGDDQAEALFLAFGATRRAMFSVARRIVGTDRAADVVQDVITRAWSGRDRFDGARGSFGPYLMMMTRSAAIDHLRSDRARRAREERVCHADPTALGDDVLLGMIAREASVRLSAALDRLSQEEHDLILTAFYGTETHTQIAERLCWPLGTVKSRIRLALRKLRIALVDLRSEVEPDTAFPR